MALEVLLNLFTAYLQERQQRVVINGKSFFSREKIKSAVLQVLCLRPLLFLIKYKRLKPRP